MNLCFYITNIIYTLLGILNLVLMWRITEFLSFYIKSITIKDIKKKSTIFIFMHIVVGFIFSISGEVFLFNEYSEITKEMIDAKFMFLHVVIIILYTSIFQATNKYMCYILKNSITTNEKTLLQSDFYFNEKAISNMVFREDTRNCVFYYDVDKKKLNVDNDIDLIIGYTKDELEHIEIIKIISEARMKSFEQFCSQKKGSCNVNTIVDARKKDGQIIIVSIMGALIKSKNKNILKGVVRDVTERVGIEVDVIKMNALFKQIVENLQGYCVFVVDKSFRYLLINEEYAKFVKQLIDIDISVGMNYADILDMNKEKIKLCGIRDYGIKYFEDAFIGKESTNTIEISNGDEKQYWEVRRVCLRENDEIIGVGVVAENITEKVNSKEEIIEAKERATSANKAKSQFLANMSHEIRTPMNGIIGLMDIVSRTKLDEEQVKLIDAAKNAANVLLDIINDILDFSKIESGEFKIIYKPFNIYELIDEIKNVFLTKKNEKGIDIEYDIDERISPYLLGDKLRLKQILINLIGNAFKFTEKGKITVRIQRINREINKVINIY